MAALQYCGNMFKSLVPDTPQTWYTHIFRWECLADTLFLAIMVYIFKNLESKEIPHQNWKQYR